MGEGVSNSPLVVLGAPRSGTSLLASWLHHSGISMGEHFLQPDAGNPQGYFEDLDFLNLHRQFLARSAASAGRVLEDSSMREQAFDFSPSAHDIDDAKRIIRERKALGQPWGWKDPRSCYFLNFWDALLPEARYLMVYRHPLEMAASIVRMGKNWDCLFDPVLPVNTWTFSMSEVLRFTEGLPKARWRVLTAEAMWDQAEQVEADVAEVWELPLRASTLETLRTSETAIGSHRISARQHAVFTKYFPMAAEVFERLQKVAPVPVSLESGVGCPDPILDFLEQHEADPGTALELLYDSVQPARRDARRCADQRMKEAIQGYLSERFQGEEDLRRAYDEIASYTQNLLGEMKEFRRLYRELREHCEKQKAHIQKQKEAIDAATSREGAKESSHR